MSAVLAAACLAAAWSESYIVKPALMAAKCRALSVQAAVIEGLRTTAYGSPDL
jgi:hypothetical protein